MSIMTGNFHTPDLSHLAIIDWELSTKLAGQDPAWAKEMLNLFIQTLPHEIFFINESYQEKNYAELLNKVHKLHGAICYCGLPRLKIIISHLETHLKNNIMDHLKPLLDQLNSEVKLLLEHPTFHQK